MLAGPTMIVQEMLKNERPLFPNQSNQWWADRMLGLLSALYPWHRFLVIVPAVGTAYHNQFGVDFTQNELSVAIYMVMATNKFEGDTKCYGNLSDKFQRLGCSTSTKEILDSIGNKCGSPRYNDESVGLRGVILEEEGKSIGFNWTLPEWAVRHELFTSACEDDDKRRFHVIIALFQQHLILSFFFYKLVKQIRERGSLGFYFKAAWLFVPKLAENELSNTLVDIERLIYTGPNSRVYFGRFRYADTEFRRVVVKVPSKDAFRVQHIVAETRINAQLRHPRVVEYIGFYRDAFDDVRIVSEFMAGGDLHTFLVDKRNKINIGHVFNFISQIAEGMEYLIQKRIIHRDLAARNCMLNEEGTQIKIADFGLSRHFNADANYSSSSNAVRMPLRWMPLECFAENGELLQYCKFNEKTDVWSFGIVVWECFTLGAQPYGPGDLQEVIVDLKKRFHHEVTTITDHDQEVDHSAFHSAVTRSDNHRLGCPGKCPQMLYDQLLLKCWADNQQMRPTFGTIRAILDAIFDAIVGIYPDTLITVVE